MLAQATTSLPPIEVVVNAPTTDWPGIVVGGIIGGLVVLTGVVLAEWLARSRELRSKVREIASGLAFDMPILMAYYADDPGSPTLGHDDFHGEFWRLRKEVFGGLTVLRTLPRWPMRNARMIRENSELLATMLTAVSLRSMRDLQLSRDDQVAIVAHDNLHSLVFGATPVSADQLDRYDKEGFSLPAVEETESE